MPMVVAEHCKRQLVEVKRGLAQHDRSTGKYREVAWMVTYHDGRVSLLGGQRLTRRWACGQQRLAEIDMMVSLLSNRR